MKWKDSLSKWRKDRNIFKPQGAYKPMIEEELQEYYVAYVNSEEHGMVDALADIMVFTANEIALMGYDLDMVMKQVVKHISSRQQDTLQAISWRMEGPDGKWTKDKSQDPSTIYEPDYTLCRLSKASS